MVEFLVVIKDSCPFTNSFSFPLEKEKKDAVLSETGQAKFKSWQDPLFWSWSEGTISQGIGGSNEFPLQMELSQKLVKMLQN